jgi:hypothetical protein
MLKSSLTPLSTTVASVGAITAVALVGGLVVVSMSGAFEARAAPTVKVAAHHPYAKGDRLHILAKGTACSSLGWPNYEQHCQFDRRRPADKLRKVRIVALR